VWFWGIFFILQKPLLMKILYTFFLLGFTQVFFGQNQSAPKLFLKDVLTFPLGAAVNPRLLDENITYR
jgi:hypothetical protein